MKSWSQRLIVLIRFFNYCPTLINLIKIVIENEPCGIQSTVWWSTCCLSAVVGAGLSGRQMHRTQGVFNHTEDYVLLPDERTISLCCWDSRTAERKNLLSLGHNNIVRCIVHSPTNPGFMTCSDDFRARFWYRRTTTDWYSLHVSLHSASPTSHLIVSRREPNRMLDSLPWPHWTHHCLICGIPHFCFIWNCAMECVGLFFWKKFLLHYFKNKEWGQWFSRCPLFLRTTLCEVIAWKPGS